MVVPMVRGFDLFGGLASLLDWSAYDSIHNWIGTEVSVAAGAYYTFVNDTGEGYLLFCQGSMNTLQPDIRITVDGVAYVFEGLVASGAHNGNQIVHPIHFKTSLKIEVKNIDSSSRSIICDYTYIKKISDPSIDNQTLLGASQRKMAFGQTSSTSLTTVVNITGSGYLLNTILTAYFSSAGANCYLDIQVDGVSVMTDKFRYNSGNIARKQPVFIGPIRYSTSLLIRHKTDSTGTTSLTRAFYTID
jgi:hypothetical protein